MKILIKRGSQEKAFNNYENESLGQLKEKHGDAFTWEELRLYMATIK